MASKWKSKLVNEAAFDIYGKRTWKLCILIISKRLTLKQQACVCTKCALHFVAWKLMGKACVVLQKVQLSRTSYFLIGNPVHVSLRMLSPEICKQCLRVTCWRAKEREEKASKPKNLFTEMNKLKHKLRQVKPGNGPFSNNCFHWNWKIKKLTDTNYGATTPQWRSWAQFCCKIRGDTLVWNQYSHRVDAEVTFYIYRFPILFLEVFWEQH